MRVSGPPRRGFCSPRRACDCVETCVHGLFGVGFVARFVVVYGLLRGHCMTCLRVSLLD